MTRPSTIDVRATVAALETGQAQPLRAALGSLGSPRDPDGRAASLALATARWHVWPEEGPLPGAPELEAAASATSSAAARDAIAVACALGARAAFLAADASGLAGYRALLATTVARPEDEVQLRLAEVLERILRGDTADVDAAARELFAQAAKLEMAGAAIAITAARALAALQNRDPGGATGHGRRASRMAQTESLPQHSYFAHLVLARIRRIQGRPHLASRILLALARVVPPPWHGWLRWELAMAGGRDAVHGHGRELSGVEGMPSLAAAHALETTLASLQQPDRRVFERAAATLVSAAAAWPELARDAVDLLYAIDARCPLDGASPEMQAWCRGAQSLPPRGIQGVGLAEAGGGESELAMVLAEPGAPARRILAAGTALIPKRIEALPIQRTSRHKGRAETALCALALAGGALTEAEVFASVYGFAYSPALHAGIVDVMLHRIRARLGDAGTLHREGERVALEIARPLLVADPRCARAVDERLLSAIARRGRATAKDAAQSLGLPLRTVQAGLRQLVEEGICIAERHGNNVEYRVEDTTFSEPTKV